MNYSNEQLAVFKEEVKSTEKLFRIIIIYGISLCVLIFISNCAYGLSLSNVLTLYVICSPIIPMLLLCVFIFFFNLKKKWTVPAVIAANVLTVICIQNIILVIIFGFLSVPLWGLAVSAYKKIDRWKELSLIDGFPYFYLRRDDGRDRRLAEPIKMSSDINGMDNIDASAGYSNKWHS